MSSSTGVALVLFDDATLERDFGWVFFYSTARWVACGQRAAYCRLTRWFRSRDGNGSSGRRIFGSIRLTSSGSAIISSAVAADEHGSNHVARGRRESERGSALYGLVRGRSHGRDGGSDGAGIVRTR